MKHSEFTTHAFITISNCGGIEIMLNKSNDGVYYRYNYGQDNLESEEIFEAEIKYTFSTDENEDSAAYFEHSEDSNVRYFLNEAMRVS